MLNLDELSIVHDAENRKFILDIDGEMAKVEYVLKNGTMFLTYSEVPYHLRGQGIGKVLVEKTFEELAAEGHKAVAVCSYIKSVARNSEKWNSIIG